MKNKTKLLALAMVAVIGSVLVANAFLTTTVYAQSGNSNGQSGGTPTDLGMQNMQGNPPPSRRGPGLPPSDQRWAGNVTIDSAQAKAMVEATIPNLKVGTVTSTGTGWIIPVEDGEGIVASIHVTTVTASTADKAKNIVEESLKNGWKAGEPQLMRTFYIVPLLDSNDATIGYVRVDGISGEIIREPSIILTVTSEQAKTIVSDAVKEFKVGDSRDMGNTWIVNVNYNDKVAITVPLGKINTPTSEDAVKAVQDSLTKGWSAGEPTQLRAMYSVPIIDANGNTIGNITIDGRTGDIIMGLPPMCR